jgi:hypothetical protein
LDNRFIAQCINLVGGSPWKVFGLPFTFGDFELGGKLVAELVAKLVAEKTLIIQ